MKKVKILLMSLLVFAAVGGALAFKVKSKLAFTLDYCTTLARLQNGAYFCTDPIGGPLTCPILALNRQPAPGGVAICTTLAPLSGNCGVDRPCINQVTFTIVDE